MWFGGWLCGFKYHTLRQNNLRAKSVAAPIDYLPALRGDYFPLKSKSCGRKFHIYVRFPEGYDPQQPRRYPVIYLLDGDSLFPLIAPTHLFLTYDERIPEAIIVGISYGGFESSINKRNIDFTAPAEDAPPGERGAPEFLHFLKDELLPVVDNQYRTDPDRRVLLGQSRGGYFVLWSALEMPDLFGDGLPVIQHLHQAAHVFCGCKCPHAHGFKSVSCQWDA